MKINHITIEREYGSGGTKIARRLAEESGISCYGQEILEEVSKEQGISVENIQKYEETVKGSFLYSLFALGQYQNGADMVTPEGRVYITEQKIISDLAKKGRSIFLGHCAFEALKDRTDVVKVFIRCSDDDEKKKRIINDYNIPEEEVEATRRRFDKKRANYYYAYTATHWDDFSHYDIVLDTAKLGIDGCVALLKALIDSQNEKNNSD